MWPLLLVSSLVSAGLGVAAVWLTPSAGASRVGPPAPPSPPAPPVPSAPPPPMISAGVRANGSIAWLGPRPDNFEALRFMLASENPERSTLVWALQAIAANNWAHRVARVAPAVRSIRDMLQAGSVKKKYTTGIGYGPQAERVKGIVRWAATSAALDGRRIAPAIDEFTSRLLSGQVDLAALRGRKGERMPSPKEYAQIISFLQADGFDDIVDRQIGPGDYKVEDKIEAWGNPPLIVEVEGIRFYGSRPARLKGSA
ncbi:MAG: hypothetical protein U1A78_26640 [Polyangia bacterium]